MSEVDLPPSIKRGDPATLRVELGVNPLLYTFGKISIRDARTKVIFVDSQDVRMPTAPNDFAVYYDMNSANTATARECEAEVKMSPGPHTYPSDGFIKFNIKPDIRP